MKSLRWILSLVAGAMVGVILHYALYRIGLPVEPFIYLAF
jgi:xanthosine utilization system XapX-like protein